MNNFHYELKNIWQWSELAQNTLLLVSNSKATRLLWVLAFAFAEETEDDFKNIQKFKCHSNDMVSLGADYQETQTWSACAQNALQ